MFKFKTGLIKGRLLLAGALLVCSMSASAVPTDYLVLEWTAGGGIKALYHRVVDLEIPRPPDRELVHRGRYVSVLDDSGLLQQQVRIDQMVRGEFAGHGHIDGHFQQLDRFVFVVRVPVSSNATLKLNHGTRKAIKSYAIADLVDSAVQKDTRKGGARGEALPNRVNLLITGDGYTAAQEADFNADVDEIVDTFLDFEPYASYRDFVTVQRLFVASNESGADHPRDPCDDGQPDPLAPLFVDTAFDASFCSFGVLRNLSVNTSKVFAAAAAVPDWDIVIAIVNDDTYGGSGGAVPVTSTNFFSPDILVHEYGHNFTSLADEYETPFPGFPDCSDVGGNAPCEPNVTDEVVRGNIKWNQLIDPATPVPTPENGTYNTVVGLFDGARYQTAGKYRPEFNCNMRTLAVPFCQVCSESYVFTLYEGNWGATTADGLSLIEPGSEVPSSFSVDGMVGSPLNFSVETLVPSHGLDVTWLVNGQEVPSRAEEGFTFTPNSVGTDSVSVEVTDRAVVVAPASAGRLPVFSRTWTVNVAKGVDLIMLSDFEIPPN